jgi:hypothetical protein
MEAHERTRLEKLLGMLGSSFDGERANAARIIASMAEARNITINELIAEMAGTQPAPSAKPAPKPPPPQDDFTDIEKADDLLRWLGRIAASPALASRVLTAWEIQFAADVSARYVHDYDLSEKQLAVTEKILGKAARAFPP